MYRVQVLQLMALVGVNLSAASCSGPQQGPTTIVSDSADVTLVMNSAAPLPQARLEEEIRIGSVDGDPPYLFDRIVSIRVGSDGNFVVVNGGSATVRVFEPDGTFSHEFGSKGGGPGEADQLFAGDLIGDTVMLVGGGSGPPRALFFTLAGGFLSSWPQYAEDRGLLTPLGVVDARWLGHVRRFASPMNWTQGQLIGDSMRIVEFVRGDGGVQANLFSRPGRRFLAQRPGEFSAGPLFDPIPRLVQLTDSTLLYTPGLRYELDVLTATGRVTRRIRRQTDPIPVTESLVEEYGRAVERYYDDRPPHPGQEEEMRRMRDGRAPLVATVPVVGQVLGGADGTFWVLRKDIEGHPVARELQMILRVETEPEEEIWEVFDPAGTAVLEVRLPIGFEPHVVALDHVVGVWRDELGVEYVVRFGVGR